MNYDEQITAMIAAIKADKDLMQPYKNYAVADAHRLQAVIRMARTTTMQKPPEGSYGNPKPDQCICGSNVVANPRCPIHGIGS